VDLTGTVLEGKDIVSPEALGIRKININRFVVEVPFNQKEESITVHLTKAKSGYEYMDFSKPTVKRLTEKNGVLFPPL
jgi:hypothetical protein